MRISTIGAAGTLLVSGAMTLGSMAAGVDKLQNGYEITESFKSDLSGDAEAYYKITNHSKKGFVIGYTSTLGTKTARKIAAADRANSNTYMLGFANGMPDLIPGSTSLGLSAKALVTLREKGTVPLTLMHNFQLDKIAGNLVLVGETNVPVIVGNKVLNVKALRATGVFKSGSQTGRGNFVFLNNRNNPMTLGYKLQFSWEKKPRELKITRLVGGPAQTSAMEQALSTIGKLELYGIHFDFGKATIQPSTNALIGEIAKTLKNNSGWKLSVEGHTDSIGGKSVNQALSQRRAASIVNALVKGHGINPGRLKAVGLGLSKPKATNKTLEGRALNRRVELVRTDR